MNIRYLSKDEILKNFSKSVIKRAFRLVVREILRTARHIEFEVYDPILQTYHIVLYKSEKRPPFDWTCDCKWYSMKAPKYCAHILAVNLNKENSI